MDVSQAEGGTRSGLLWEVERILDELNERPQILIMENVPEVIGTKNINNFKKWELKLESLGYNNFVKILNAKDYGIPQNRRRCFMISILGDYAYDMPIGMKLKYHLKDFLEKQVNDKYYISDKMVRYITAGNVKWTGNNDQSLINKSIASTINTGEGSRRCDASNYVSEDFEENTDLKSEIIKVGKTKSGGQRSEIISGDGVCSTLTATDYKQPKQIAVSNEIKVIDVYNKHYLKDNKIVGTIPAGYSRNQGCMIQESEDDLVLHGTLSGGKWDKINESCRRVYDEKGVAPTISTCCGGNHEPKVAINDEPKLVGGIGEKKSNGGRQFYQQDRVYDGNGIAMCHPTNLPDGSYKYLIADDNEITYRPIRDEERFDTCCIVEEVICYKEYEFAIEYNEYTKEKMLIPLNEDSKKLREEIGVPDLYFGDIYNLTEYNFLNWIYLSKNGINKLHIRKLTPKECLRLMGFQDNDYEAIKAVGMSDSMIYHQAGDSIVVSVLIALFAPLFKEPSNHREIISEYVETIKEKL